MGKYLLSIIIYYGGVHLLAYLWKDTINIAESTILLLVIINFVRLINMEKDIKNV